MSSEAAKSVKFLTHPPCAYHTGTDITYIQLLTLTDNKTALMYKNKSKNEVFVQSSSWFWLLQQFSTQLQKTQTFTVFHLVLCLALATHATNGASD